MSVIKVLSAEAVERLFTIPMAIEAVERAYREKHSGQGGTWPMVFHEFDPGHADLDIKSGHLGGAGVYGLKVVSWFGDNPERGLPALYGTSLVFDLATGATKALVNAGPITHSRTGAAAAIGAKYLARRGHLCRRRRPGQKGDGDGRHRHPAGPHRPRRPPQAAQGQAGAAAELLRQNTLT